MFYSDSDSSSTNSTDDDEPLYPGCNVGKYVFENRLQEISTNHTLSTRCCGELLQLFKDVLPPTANIPSLYSFSKAPKDRVSEFVVQDGTKSGTEHFLVFDLARQLSTVVSNNWHALWKSPPDQNVATVISDIRLPDRKALYLQMHTDGGRLQYTSKSVWPVMFTVLNLPPQRRSKFSNVILGALWMGNGKPDWNKLLVNVIDQMERLNCFGLTITRSDDTRSISVRVLILTADMIAKAPLLNHIQFNGRYGCNICYHPGVNFQRRHIYPPFAFEIRRDKEYQHYAHKAEQSSEISKGIKGKCAVSKIVQIPSGVVIDSMHQVHLGVFRHLVLTWLSSVLKTRQLEVIDAELVDVQVPHDITRPPRSLKLASSFKAQEWKRLLLYIGPLVLRSVLKKELYAHFLLLSSAIYALSGVHITPEDIATARRHLEQFHRDIQLHYDWTAYTYNAHSLLHLADQVERWGPLWSTSAFFFESAMGKLSRLLAGPTAPLSQISQRFFAKQQMEPSSNSGVSQGLVQPLGERFAIDESTRDALPPHATAVGVYHRAKVSHKVYHSFRYSKRGNSRCSHIASTKSGDHLLLDAFALTSNGVLFAIGQPLQHLPREEVIFSSDPLFPPLSHFHGVHIPISGTLISVAAVDLACRCIVYKGANHWLICDMLEEFEHD